MIQMPRGTRDVLPAQSYKWQYIERVMMQLCADFGYKEIRVPTFEHIELFSHGVGESTDVVRKEMYTLTDRDKGVSALALRPEGTAGVMRSFIENGLYGGLLPLKAYYILSCFRYEKPQAGRLREFHQFGAEVLGSAHPRADTEVISLAHELFERLGVRNLRLNINSLGCRECRPGYIDAIRTYFEGHAHELCEDCRERLERNPMRIVDCKNPRCGELAKGAPVILDYICGECASHFDEVKTGLSDIGIKYEIDPCIVRGLDYYSKTVFEFISDEIGAQSTVCGGGRYDYLSELVQGPSCPGLGFAMGIERLMLLMDAQGISMGEARGVDIYIAPMGDEARGAASGLCHELRRRGISCESDISGRSIKAQMKYADKTGAAYTLVIGSDELKSGGASLRNMSGGGSYPVRLSDVDGIANIINN